MRLRLGFIGLGAMGLSHVQSMLRLGGDKVEVAAFCANDETHIRQAREWVPSAEVFSWPTDLIGSRLDAIFVSTPNFQHAALAKQIISAGKHLFLEKPCGVTAAECQQVLEVARKTDRVLMLGHEL